MNTHAALTVAAKISELVQLTSTFQSLYGKQYRMKPGSPAAAWELHTAIFDQQSIIATLLDTAALERPLKRGPEWWKWQDTIDVAVTIQLAAEANHLIACCAAFEANPLGDESYIVKCSQAAIAGMLHPSTLMIAQAHLETAC